MFIKSETYPLEFQSKGCVNESIFGIVQAEDAGGKVACVHHLMRGTSATSGHQRAAAGQRGAAGASRLGYAELAPRAHMLLQPARYLLCFLSLTHDVAVLMVNAPIRILD